MLRLGQSTIMGESVSNLITSQQCPIKGLTPSVACGMISQYNASNADELYGVRNLPMVVSKRLTMRGFIVLDPDMGARYAKDHLKNVSKWISEGTFKTQESVTYGIDNGVKGLLGMLKGDNFGKAVLQIDELKVS